MWFASRQPTTADRCSCMSASTGSASTSRIRVPPLLYALPWSSSELQLHCLETSLKLRQGQDSQGPPESRTKPKKMKTWLTYSTSWEEADPCDQEHWTRDFFSIIIYFHLLLCTLLLSLLLCADFTFQLSS